MSSYDSSALYLSAGWVCLHSGIKFLSSSSVVCSRCVVFVMPFYFLTYLMMTPNSWLPPDLSHITWPFVTEKSNQANDISSFVLLIWYTSAWLWCAVIACKRVGMVVRARACMCEWACPSLLFMCVCARVSNGLVWPDEVTWHPSLTSSQVTWPLIDLLWRRHYVLYGRSRDQVLSYLIAPALFGNRLFYFQTIWGRIIEEKKH